MKLFGFFWIIYLVISIVTFGHAWNNVTWTETQIINGGRDIGSFSCGVGWPLYWSVKVFEN